MTVENSFSLIYNKSKLIFTVYSAKTSFISYLEPVSFASECEVGVEKNAQ